jgi:hypothetical protein
MLCEPQSQSGYFEAGEYLCSGRELNFCSLSKFLHQMHNWVVLKKLKFTLKGSSPVTGLEWPRGFQEVKVKQSRYRPGVAQRVPGS